MISKLKHLDSHVRNWLAIGLALHLAAAIFSTGYQNTDEHFQIMEFLATWMGKAPAGELAIEYQRQMRPWLQPLLYWVPVRALQGLGVESPFAWATAIRLVSALIGWASAFFLTLCAMRWIKDLKWRRAAIITIALTWYLPALHARHSSENLSGAVMTIALCWLALARERERGDGTVPSRVLWGAGFLCGLAFEFRYQVGVMAAGAFLWLALVAQARLSGLARFVAGGLLAVALGTVLDRIGYGRWVFAPWNYFEFNVLEGRLDAAGVHPVWDYFRRIWTESWPVLAFVNLMGLLVFWVRYPRHIFTWALLSFFLFHTVTGHKETRFLFPMAHAAPLALIMALYRSGRWVSGRPFRIAAWSVITLNGVALVALTFLPALFFTRFYAAVYDLAQERRPKALVLNYLDDNPYRINGIPMHYYRPPRLVLQAANLSALRNAPESWLAYPRPTLPEPIAATGLRCEPRFTTYPGWVRSLVPAKFMRNIRDWTLFQCRP